MGAVVSRDVSRACDLQFYAPLITANFRTLEAWPRDPERIVAKGAA
jgi:hypothetical protein